MDCGVPADCGTKTTRRPPPTNTNRRRTAPELAGTVETTGVFSSADLSTSTAKSDSKALTTSSGTGGRRSSSASMSLWQRCLRHVDAAIAVDDRPWSRLNLPALWRGTLKGGSSIHCTHPSGTGIVLHPLRPIRRLTKDAKEKQNKLTTRADNEREGGGQKNEKGREGGGTFLFLERLRWKTSRSVKNSP